MKEFGKTAVLVLVLLAHTGCTTMRALEERSPATIQQSVERGDRVRIAASDGKVYELEVTQVEAASLTGRADNGKRYKVPYSSIQAMEVREVDVFASVGAGLATIYVVAGVLLVVALHNLDFHFGICE